MEHWTDKDILQACSFTHFCNNLYENIVEKLKHNRPISTNKQEFIQWQEKSRINLIHLLKIEDLLKTPSHSFLVEGKHKSSIKEKSITLHHFYIKSWMNSLIPVYIAIPDNSREYKKRPAVVCLHGHGMRKEDLVGLSHNIVYPGMWALDLAKMGCISIVADQWGFGERGSVFKRNSYDHLEKKYALNILLLGKTLNGLRIYDAIQQINYLLSRDDVDPSRIGIAGLSMGGTIASYVTALDTRVDLAVVAGFLSTYKASIINRVHCSDNYIPDILNLGELGDILSLIAPRNLFFINGIRDPIFPIESAVQSFNHLQSIYDLFCKKENIGIDITPKGHRWRGSKAYEFIHRKWFSRSFSNN